jgi:hypothetical protein
MRSDIVFSTGARRSAESPVPALAVAPRMYRARCERERKNVPALAVAPFGFYHRESRDKVEEWKSEKVKHTLNIVAPALNDQLL